MLVSINNRRQPDWLDEELPHGDLDEQELPVELDFGNSPFAGSNLILPEGGKGAAQQDHSCHEPEALFTLPEYSRPPDGAGVLDEQASAACHKNPARAHAPCQQDMICMGRSGKKNRLRGWGWLLCSVALHGVLVLFVLSIWSVALSLGTKEDRRVISLGGIAGATSTVLPHSSSDGVAPPGQSRSTADEPRLMGE